MISSRSIALASGNTAVLRLTTAAQVRVERHFGMPLFEALDAEKHQMSVEKIAVILGAAANDGKGCSEDEAFELVDDMGGAQAAGQHLGAVLEAAFPQADTDAPKGSGAPSGKVKKPAA
ncbi:MULTISPECIES: hypothetical protein [unclassified Sulfitobacter]|uniref:hypothetical protein n=1 Tax=unclassified Sulfitobacter TaxID=196795 RepID=UPI0007C2B55C|nr:MULTISPECIES: hypothetical protein [unclassified Sulfitobacter]KZX90391.1 hypothetical protein A3720_10420 [Sulfitobacter sp. HI0021]KZY04217.1 hypothetical protein A3722_19520 [Sulfitobacter sp. HI0027]KZZ01836.1 hypothetical protein A3747_17900 [Sulfitobacter sp. HI0076]